MRVKVPSRRELTAKGRKAPEAIANKLRKDGENALQDVLTFFAAFAIVVGILILWNIVQNLDASRTRLWGELALFGLIVWFAIAVLSVLVCSLIEWLVRRMERRTRWLRFLRLKPVSTWQALAWAAVVMISVPIAILFRFAGFAVLIGVTTAVYLAFWYLSKRHERLPRLARVPRLAVPYAALVGTVVLCAFAAFSRDADVASATLAPATAPVADGEEVARELRPLLFFDRDERFEPVDIGDADVQGCSKTLLAGGCEPVAPEASLDAYEYLTVTGTALERGERPGGPDSAYYFHVVEEDGRVYVDYWWYFAHNPAPVAAKLLCGPALKWLSEACAEHPADWEGITIVLTLCRDEQPAEECVTGGGQEFALEEIRYAQHDKVVVYPWAKLRDAWGATAFGGLAKDSGLRPLVFVALSSHASYAAPCPPASCKQIAHPTFSERRNGAVPWTNNGAECGGDCLQALPIDQDGVPTSWNAFSGRWGAQHCILFGSYCNTQRAPKAPSFQDRYLYVSCPPKLCTRSDRL